ncbi:lysozyme inhibitor LprI family protein [Methylobacterium iners]|uniref:Lysozyme inhibitor LprI-like N-terminal domain-containing protein n=1 Tax=Methylobacterium iners TaxID=418707 RepID=A0ABQ4S0P3_9HYPH|nr:lysozyme inhibitor LprI family protein [Methylobacterium iners]GJD95489.1 hypothetical protein OCOJLMKI_2702 [Methylobacterium iners]
MLRPALSCFFAALALAAGPARAEPGPDCKNPVTQLDMNICASEAYGEADARLNRTYAKLVKALEPDRIETLRAAQRAWVTFRERECAFAGSEVGGGSMQPMIISGCARTLTEQRVKDLEKHLR